MASNNSSTTASKPAGGLSAEQVQVIGAVERSFSVVSLVCCAFIFFTFWWFPSFRKPINRLIIWASVGNVVATLATLISTSGIAAGAHSPLCQTQAFLIQFVLPADSFWSLAMATNVYLTFFRGYDAHDLRKLEKRYATLCYGIPLIVALIYLVLDFVQADSIYGPAVIWCWVGSKWEWMRVAFFYGPVWVSIVITLGLYSLTAREILNRRRELHALSNSNHDTADVEMAAPKSLFKNPFYNPTTEPIRKVTRIEVTTEQLYRTSSHKTADTESSGNSRTLHSSSSATVQKNSLTLDHEMPATAARPSEDEEPQTPLHKFSTTVTAATTPAGRLTNHHAAPDMAHLSVSPYQAAYRDPSVDFPPRPSAAQQANMSTRRQRKDNARRNNAAWSYAKVSLLFFTALFIVWVPSTVNRIYSLARPESPSYGLSVAAAAVLPTQGFWNAMVYSVTSWAQCKAAIAQIKNSKFIRWLSCTAPRRSSQCAPVHNRRTIGSHDPLHRRTALSSTTQRPSAMSDSFPRTWRPMELQEALDMDPKHDEQPGAHPIETKTTKP